MNVLRKNEYLGLYPIILDQTSQVYMLNEYVISHKGSSAGW